MLSSSNGELPIIHQLSTLDNKTLSLQANGQKTIVYFFAPWCQICHMSIGNLQSLFERKPHIKVIAVALDFVDQNEVAAFTERHQLTFPVALGNEAVKQDFQVQGYPSYYVLDEENTVISRSLGYSSELGLYLRSF
ncbi:Thiol-disulfide isomerase or thioredoxin [Colwellia chukchiensis]|uniref:Thiol-disulfide isomerase or thioredoxin n=2 Tax=Colwellia chukchiensis TaxID=641665 RepID=A0A1H7MV69_9GAMM|nr:Thiol-disulfide isomerase or thioredoxin [Colwellia chukchiensis]